MSKFYPKMYQKDIYSINYKKLKELNIKCLLFDLDNTCIPYKETTYSKKLKNLFNKLTVDGFKVIIFSNSPEKRLQKFSSLGVDYNSLSLKPLSHSFNKIIKNYKYNKDEVCIIGDQLLTDVLGGNLVGIYTCLIDPISDNELFFTRISRKIEAIIFNRFNKQKKLIKGEYYD